MVEVAILIGLQASGKTSFYRSVLASTHEHVSKDTFRNARRRQRRQLRLIAQALDAGRDVAVDNTNPSPAEWAPIVELARQRGASVVGYWFPPDLAASQVRNAARQDETRVPEIALYATIRRLTQPGPRDGFDHRYTVRFNGTGGFVIRPIVDDEVTKE